MAEQNKEIKGCECAERNGKSSNSELPATPGIDPRFQQMNQSLRCFVMYRDFYRCERILGPELEECKIFKKTYNAICPNAWIEKWDELRSRGLFPGKEEI